MLDFETQLDKIRIKLYEQTKDLHKKDVIKSVNTDAEKIATKYGIKIISTAAATN
jgi:hypothetical protein